MAATYPDVIGEYVDTPERFATGGLQYAGYFSAESIIPGQVAYFYLVLQNTLNVALEATVRFTSPQSGGFLRAKKPLLQIDEEEIAIKLGAAEVGILTIPLIATEYAENGECDLTVEAKAAAQEKGERIRPTKSNSFLDNKLIDSPVGLNLVGSLGATYVERNAKKAVFPVIIAGAPGDAAEQAELNHSYEIIWRKKEAKFFTQAVQEVHLREVKLRKELNVEAIYANLYGESTQRFADVGLPLRIGEAIVLAKILTYTCQYFMADSHRFNGLMVPIWEHALESEMDTTHSLEVIRSVGYYHVIKLAIALSFGLLNQLFNRQLWPRFERQALANHIANNIDLGQPLDMDFLYLPLLLAGTQICDKVRFQGEDVKHTLALMKKARDARIELFTEEDMAQADKVYNRILTRALA
jgi:hypothetical protein